MDPRPVTLVGRHVRLEPLGLDHVPGLMAAGADESIWRFMPYGTVVTSERMTAHVQDVLVRQERGTDVPFAVVLQATGQPVGCTRYLNIERPHRGLEIGGTWYTPAQQRTGVNTECKYLLLRHAFESLGCLRVQLRTDSRNERSQRAIERIGAIREGVLRKHMLLPDGYVRDTVVYSVVDNEWPAVKALLERLMQR
jgi:RimJ/RimL family protein N-acetyltransferase